MKENRRAYVAVAACLVLVLASLVCAGFPFRAARVSPFSVSKKGRRPTNFPKRSEDHTEWQRSKNQNSFRVVANLHGKVLAEGLLMERSRAS